MPRSSHHTTPEQPVLPGQGFVTPATIRDGLTEYVYQVPSHRHMGRMACALRIEASDDYLMPETLAQILDFAEWAIQQQQASSVTEPRHPNRPQLVP